MRTYLLTEAEREEILHYLKHRPRSMSDVVRQIRLRAKTLDFDAIRKDLELVEQLHNLRIKVGRKPKIDSAAIPAKFDSKQPGG